MARISRLDANPEVGAGGAGAPLSNEELAQHFPRKLLRRYEVRFAPLSSAAAKPSRLRDLGAHALGKFVTAECMVIRASDVKPLIEVAVYACDVCGYETYQELVGKAFTPLTECVSESCRMNKTPGAIRMQVRARASARRAERGAGTRKRRKVARPPLRCRARR
jgi:DNA replicative helicase MCM subunit Mcm2 (Cdc46/Mcm family)